MKASVCSTWPTGGAGWLCSPLKFSLSPQNPSIIVIFKPISSMSTKWESLISRSHSFFRKEAAQEAARGQPRSYSASALLKGGFWLFSSKKGDPVAAVLWLGCLSLSLRQFESEPKERERGID